MSNASPIANYDLEGVYDREIYPLMAQILEICNREGMPVVASFAYGHRDGETLLCTSTLSRQGWQPSEFRAAMQMITKGFEKLVGPHYEVTLVARYVPADGKDADIVLTSDSFDAAIATIQKMRNRPSV